MRQPDQRLAFKPSHPAIVLAVIVVVVVVVDDDVDIVEDDFSFLPSLSSSFYKALFIFLLRYFLFRFCFFNF